MNRTKSLLFFLLPAGLFFLLACGGGKDTSGDSLIGETPDSAADSAHAKYNRLISNIPIPFDIMKRLTGSGITYRDSLVNPVARLSNYSKSNIQAMNLGIYGADLTYVISMEQFGQVASHIKAVKKLADIIVIPTAFDEGMMERYNENRNNRDSLENMIFQSYRRIDITLKSNERISLAALVVAGGWIESLYLTTQHLQRDPDSDKNKILYEIMSDQQRHLGNLVSLLADFKDDEYIQGLKNDLAELKGYYLPGGSFDAEALKKITEKIASIRKTAVESQ
ncbi:MAG: hypothetical protein FD123_1350 [Bacteroidetes bacterium]|nr:MAG: hypothetical protein FD123_1350 [Bacteroidota bacterium]